MTWAFIVQISPAVKAIQGMFLKRKTKMESYKKLMGIGIILISLESFRR